MTVGINVEWLRPALDDFAVDHDFFRALEARQLVHRVEKDAFHNRPQSACTGLPRDRLLCDSAERVPVEVLAVQVQHAAAEAADLAGEPCTPRGGLTRRGTL